MKQNYFVSVFVGGKCVNAYYSENLDELMTVKAMNKDCDIFIMDTRTYQRLSKRDVEREIQKAGVRWKKAMERQREKVPPPVSVEEKPKKEKPKKYWERPVLCVETGQVFNSIRECSDMLGIPYMTITNCIKNKNATRGVHFVNAKKEE